jgi:ubiquinone/menaquinone biosynthesis C-methylase UbiE
LTSDATTQHYYDDFARHYDDGRDRGYHRLIDDLESGVVSPLAHGKEVLEVGCGTGLLLQRIAAIAARAEGIDLSLGMLERAQARGLTVRQGSATDLPYPDASFDVTYSFKVLAHVPDLPRALAEMARVTRPGGYVIYELYNRHSLRYLARWAAGARRIGVAHDESDVLTRWHTPRQMRELAPIGTEVVSVVGVRIATPAALLHRVALLGAALDRLERRLSRGRLAVFGGFVVIVARRT